MKSSINECKTIFALASAIGKAGISVIRVSGPNIQKVYESITTSKKLPTERLFTNKTLYNPLNKSEVLDRCLLVYFKGPRSFTSQDVLEFHVHGGNAVVGATLKALSSVEGCRPAERGEFTRRAFENHKLDLTELEGLRDLIDAETEAQRKLALRQSNGSLKHYYDELRLDIIHALSLVEAYIDFGEDEQIEDNVLDDAKESVLNLIKKIENHLNDDRKGEILRNGIRLAICGPPNAGKSTLLNKLANREAAIVSPLAGTTRDVIELSLNIGGYPVIISDTAGIRNTDQQIEKLGVDRALKVVQESDLTILMLDLPELLNKQILPEEIKIRGDYDNLIILLNKSDQLIHNALTTSQKELLDRILNPIPKSKIWLASAKQEGKDFDNFIKGLSNQISNRFDLGFSHDPIITDSRHRYHLNDCLEFLKAFIETPSNAPVEAAEELRYGALALGRITGRVDVEEVLDALFAGFCIGK